MPALSTPRTTQQLDQEVQQTIRWTLDFPKAGVRYADVLTTITGKPDTFAAVTDSFIAQARTMGVEAVAAIAASGVPFGAALALHLNCPLILIEKAGGCPPPHLRIGYGMTYASSTIEICTYGLKTGQRVAVIDDVLATGGTARAAAQLLSGAGLSVCGALFVGEVADGDGRAQLEPIPVFAISLLDYTQRQQSGTGRR